MKKNIKAIFITTTTIFLLISIISFNLIKNTPKNNLELYILQEINNGSPGIRYGCGKNNDINGYDCGSTFDQASMINMYSELYLATYEKKYIKEALNFGVLGNSTCGANIKNNICGEAKQQGEFIVSLIKIYLISKNTEIKKMIIRYLDLDIDNINLKNGKGDYHNWGISTLAQAYITGNYFLKDKEYLDKYYLLKEKIDKKSVYFQNLLLLENLYLNKNNNVNINIIENIDDELISINYFGKYDFIEFLSFNEKYNFLNNINNSSENVKIEKNMFQARSLLSYSQTDNLKIKDIINIELLNSLSIDPGKKKHYKFSNEADNYVPFYMGIYNIIFKPKQKLSWNLDKNKYEKVYKEKNIYSNYKSNINLKKRKLFCLVTLKNKANNNLNLQLYLKNNISKQMTIEPIFDEKYINYKYSTNIKNKIILEKNSELLSEFNIESEKLNIYFYGLYFKYNLDENCYLDPIYF